MRAVALLSVWKIKNSLRTLFTDPRKVIPLAIFVLCLAFPIWMSATVGSGTTRRPPGEFHVDPLLFQTVTFLVMILLGIGTIDTGLGDGLLAFGMSDVDYLFPSPISRRVVLAYRLPALTLGALSSSLFVIYIFRMATMILSPAIPGDSHAPVPGWMSPACIALCIGLYLNIAMFVAVRFQNRKTFHRVLMGFFYLAGGTLICAGWFGGLAAVTTVLNWPVVTWLFYPSKLASDAMNADLAHHFVLGPIRSLGIGYFISFFPMFMTNSNFYEQSISSSERVSVARSAARGGYASLMAAKAANYKRKITRTYTIPPFGSGPFALLWAHLCAAGKRPFVNFGAPLAAGIFDGAFAAFANGPNRHLEGFGYAALVGLTAYLSFGFMASAKTSSESAIRRRELIAPLPIKGWQGVAANLGVPFLAVVLFSVAAAVSYSIGLAPNWPIVLFGLCVFFPIRMASRMILQYMVVLGYPDFSDKVQQFLAMGVYYLLAAPLILMEVVVCVPAFLLRSFWLGLVMLTLFEIAVLGVMLLLGGAATDRAVASGEPVNLFRLLSRKAAATA